MNVDISDLNVTRFADLEEFINYALDFFMSVAVLVAVIFIVVTGFTYILSFGDENKIQKANKALVYIIVGLAVSLIAPLLIRFLLEQIMGA
jgi:formate-dependent nitrite reductase membrane component NrfD